MYLFYKQSHNISCAIHFYLPDDILIEKLLGRRICENCGRGYNICNIDRDGICMPPILPNNNGLCDICGGKLIKRDDDKYEIIHRRLEIFKKNTNELLEFYQESGIN